MWGFILLLLLFTHCTTQQPVLPNVTLSGYAPVDDTGAKLFYAFYEAAGSHTHNHNHPVLLWLQGGPGCASMFGNLYELGAQRLVRDTPTTHNASSTPLYTLEPNPWAWNRRSMALLFIDQPIGTGYSLLGKSRSLPEDEATVAADVYVGLQYIFSNHEQLRGRTLIVAGESYAVNGTTTGTQPLTNRPLPERMLLAGPPVFQLAGAAIGNGLTAPDIQVMTHADVAYSMGLVSVAQSIQLMKQQLEVQQHVVRQQWREAWHARTELLDLLAKFSGAATLLDVRRDEEYDAEQAVQTYLNDDGVKAHLGVPTDVHFESCSAAVGESMGPDVMRSVLHLLPDVVQAVPVLLYQGQYDVQDGPASCGDWIHVLPWQHQQEFNRASRTVVRQGDVDAWEEMEQGRRAVWAVEGDDTRDKHESVGGVVGWWQSYKHLTTAVVRDAGHMVPHDQGQVAAYMMESWVEGIVNRRKHIAAADDS